MSDLDPKTRARTLRTISRRYARQAKRTRSAYEASRDCDVIPAMDVRATLYTELSIALLKEARAIEKKTKERAIKWGGLIKGPLP